MASVVTDETGLGTRLASLRASLSQILQEVDPARITGPDALSLYESAAAMARDSEAFKTLLAPRLDTSGIWKDSGHRSAEAMMAELSGESAGQAKTTLLNGIRLAQLPGTEAALRAGELSAPKLTELTSAGILAPEREQELLKGAGEASLKVIKDRCQRSRATGPDAATRMKKIYDDRYFSSWIDPEGGFCYKGRDTPERGAQLLSKVEIVAERLRKEHKATSDDHTDDLSERAVRADAFFALVTGVHPDSGAPLGTNAAIEEIPLPGSSLIDPGPKADVVVRVDLDALLRGYTEEGECCEIDRVGPIPVQMARDLASDSFLRVLFHQAGDIKAISHMGRTINQKLRTALVDRDPACVVPGCGISYGLEIDHVIPVTTGGPTELNNLCRLCHHHHFLKTFEGWQLKRHGPTDADPNWTFTPMPPFGQEPDLGLDLPGRTMGMADPDPPRSSATP